MMDSGTVDNTLTAIKIIVFLHLAVIPCSLTNNSDFKEEDKWVFGFRNQNHPKLHCQKQLDLSLIW